MCIRYVAYLVIFTLSPRFWSNLFAPQSVLCVLIKLPTVNGVKDHFIQLESRPTNSLYQCTSAFITTTSISGFVSPLWNYLPSFSIQMMSFFCLLLSQILQFLIKTDIEDEKPFTVPRFLSSMSFTTVLTFTIITVFSCVRFFYIIILFEMNRSMGNTRPSVKKMRKK